MDAVAQLQAIAPAEEMAEQITVTSRQRDTKTGRTVENKITHVITPFTYRKMFKVLAHVNTIYMAIKRVNFDFAGFLAALEADTLDFNKVRSLIELVMGLSAESGDAIVALTALAVDRPIEYLDTVLPDDGLALTVKVLKVNKDFFVQRILPLLPALQTEATEAVTQPGSTQ